MIIRAPNQPLLWSEKEKWAVQAHDAQVEGKSEPLYTLVKFLLTYQYLGVHFHWAPNLQQHF